MKDFFAGCWMIYMMIAFVFVAFGIWGAWTLLGGLIIGLIFAILT